LSSGLALCTVLRDTLLNDTHPPHCKKTPGQCSYRGATSDYADSEPLTYTVLDKLHKTCLISHYTQLQNNSSFTPIKRVYHT